MTLGKASWLCHSPEEEEEEKDGDGNDDGEGDCDGDRHDDVDNSIRDEAQMRTSLPDHAKGAHRAAEHSRGREQSSRKEPLNLSSPNSERQRLVQAPAATMVALMNGGEWQLGFRFQVLGFHGGSDRWLQSKAGRPRGRDGGSRRTFLP